MTVNRVAVVSNMHEQCGNAEDARLLSLELMKYYEYVSWGHDDVIQYPVDAVIFSWHPARVRMDIETVRKPQLNGAKVIVIYQNSSEQKLEVGNDHALFHADAVVAHEPIEANIKVRYIPVGIPEVKNLAEQPGPGLRIGTAGFPFEWKRFDVVAEVAKRFQAKCVMIAPTSDQNDREAFIGGVQGHLGPLAEIYRQWMPIDEVVRLLSTCTVNIVWFESKSYDDTLGQSGSVRMGLAAKRPMIISTHRKLRTLFDYYDELYIARTESEVYEAVKSVIDGSVKRPSRIFADQSWTQVGLMYKGLIDEVVGHGVN